MHIVYAIGSYLAFWVLLPFLLVHPKTRHGLAERLGIYGDKFATSGRGLRFWLHGASAGDLMALSPIVRALKERFPDCTVLVTTLTNSGYQMARERLPGIDAVAYAPYDLPGATRRAVRALAPDVLVLEYTEIWPNLIRAAKRAGALVVLTNGRFSQRRLSWYRLLFRLVGNPLACLDLFLMREDDEAERAVSLGAPPDRVVVTGNTKFDALVSAAPGRDEAELARAIGFPPDARIFVAGSTHEGEEPLVLDVFRRLLLDAPDLRLVVAPRYVERAPRVLALAQAASMPARLRSAGPSGPTPRVVVLDTIGELTTAYRLATLVFVGGSFTSRGGQNILEPAAQGRPVLFGPNMENFHDSVQVLVGRGAIQVNDSEHLFRVANDLLKRPEKIAELGALARGAVTQISGASTRNAELIAALLATPPSSSALGEGSRDPKKILVIRYSALGDVVLATPAVRALKARFPEAEIHWLTHVSYAPLLDGLPFVDRVIRYEKQGVHAGVTGMRVLRSLLAAQRYDLCVDLQRKPRTWLLRHVASRRVVVRGRGACAALASVLGRDVVVSSPHTIERYGSTIEGLGCRIADRHPVVVCAPTARRPRAAIAPGGRWVTKRWPAERYAEVARQLHDRGLEVVLVGGPDDQDVLKAVRSGLPFEVTDTVGLPLDATVRHLAACELFVGNDTGPAHLAAAVGTPTVAIFGPTPVERWRPVGLYVAAPHVPMPCAPCSNHGGKRCPKRTHACMRDLPVSQVIAAVSGLRDGAAAAQTGGTVA